MLGFWILLLAVHIMYSFAGLTSQKTYYEQKMYGDTLSIRLPTWSDKVTFTSVDETVRDVLWSRYQAAKRGSVTGTDDDRKFQIYSVTFDDQGIYTVENFWGKKSSTYLLKVITKRSSQYCVAGETFKISLGRLAKNDAKLSFLSEDFNLTLVDHGSPVGNLHPDYIGRIQVTSSSIEVLNVNVSDVGNYTLSDHLNRKVRIISMSLVDHHPVNVAPIIALMAFLGIPPVICCCCRKRICKKSSQTNTIAMKFDNQDNPQGPPPVYVSPAHPSGPAPAYTPGYPAVGETIVHPPPNPTFPPQPPSSGYPATSPAIPPPNPTFNPEYNNLNPLYPPPSGVSPAQPPQWSSAPNNQPAPAGFVPTMYNAPPGPEPVKGEVTATTPLLAPPQSEVPQNSALYTGIDVLNNSDAPIQFNIDKGNDSSTKFL